MSTTALRNQTIYSDIRGDMAPNPATDDLLLLSNENAVKESIKGLLSTNKYERIWNKRIGSNIRALLFENDTPLTQYALREAILETIDNYEPRAIILDVTIIPSPDENAYYAQITFSLKNSEDPVELSVILNRVR